jgi:tetratricopeptide (TPR) repeat protein
VSERSELSALATARLAVAFGDGEQALDAADQARSEVELLGGATRTVRGLALALLGRNEEALEELRAALATFEQAGDDVGLAARLDRALVAQYLVEPDDQPDDLAVLAGEVLASGNPAEALLAATVAAASRPDEPEPALVHGRVRLAIGDLGTARAELERVIELGGDPTAHLDLFDLAVAEGDEDEAATHLAALQPWPALDSPTLVEVARRLIVLGRFDDAAELTPAVDVTDANAMARRVVAAVHEWQGDDDAAIEVLERSRSSDPPTDDPDVYLHLGRLVAGRDGNDAGLVISDEGLRYAGVEARLLNQRAEQLLELGRLAEAEAAADWAVALRPDSETILVTLANVLGTRGKVDEARAAADRALALQPTFLPAFQAKVEAMRVSGDIDGALAVIQTARELDPEDAWTRRQLTLALWRSAEVKEWPAEVLQQAVDAAREWQASSPGDALAVVIEARALDRLDRPAEAVAAYERALELDPGGVEARLELAQLFERLERVDEAVAHFDRVVADHPDLPRFRLLRALFRRTHQDFEGAAADLTVVIDADPANGDAWSERAEVWRRAGQYERALEDIEQALRLKADDGWSLGTKGQILRALGRDAEAIEALDQAATLADEDDRVWIDTERLPLSRRLGRLEEAAGLAAVVLARSPDNVVALSELGEVCRLQGRLEEARDALERAVALNPDEPFALGTLGQVLIEQRELGPAAERLARAAELDPDTAWIRSSLADAYRLLGRSDEALAEIDRAIELEPESSTFRSTRAETLRARGDPSAALAEAEGVLETNPEDWFTLGTAAQAQLDLGRPLEALELAERAVTAHPGYGFGWSAHTGALVDLDRYPEALVSARRYREAEPESLDALAMQSAVLTGLGRVEEARDLLLESEQEPTPFVRYMRGVTLLLLGEAERAVPELAEAVRADEDDAWNHAWLADALAVTGDAKQAELHWTRSVDVTAEVSAPAASVLAISGWCKLCLGEHEASARRYLRAVGLGTATMSIRFEAVVVLVVSGQDEHARRQLDDWFADLEARPTARRRGLLREARHVTSLVDRFGLVDPKGRPAFDALAARVQQALDQLPAEEPEPDPPDADTDDKEPAR